MMRWVLLAMLVVAASAGLTYLASVMPSGPDTAVEGPVLGGPADEEEAIGPPPRAVVEGDPVHDFGVMPQDDKGRHTWIVKNEGQGDLKLKGGHPACSCTVLSLAEGETKVLKPGESFSLEVEWETRMNRDRYEKQAAIYTNDPNHRELVFVVTGIVQPALVTIPPQPEFAISAGQVRNDQPREFHAMVASPAMPEMAITGIINPRPDLMEVRHEPLTADEQISLRVKSGHKVTVTVRPTPQLGSFVEQLLIRTDNPKAAEVPLRIAGRVVGPVTVVPETVRLFDVSGPKGGEVHARIWVQDQAETRFTVAKKPDALKVAVEPADDKGEAEGEPGGRAYRLIVTVPPGTPTTVINGTIDLETDHPRASEVRVPVYVRVLAG